MPPKVLTLLKNSAIPSAATNSDTSTVGEPSVAVSGDNVFMSGNWYAARSLNGGDAWTHVDPFALPNAAGGFCCDQLVLFDARRQVWIWILQFSAAGGSNVFRIGIMKAADFPTGTMHWWDIAPTIVNAAWANLWFDYPDASLTVDSLFLTFNQFDTADNWQRAVVMRFPLNAIAAGTAMTFNWWATQQNGSLRLTQGAGTSMYFGSHVAGSDRSIRVFRWDDGGAQIQWWTVPVTPWTATGYTSMAPNGVNWLGRTDGRITGAWVANGTIGFMWTGGKRANRPQPYLRVVRINEVTKVVQDEPDIWSTTRAWSYPSAAPNDRGEIGFTAFYGGGDKHPGHVVGVRDDALSAWKTKLSKTGSHSPVEPKWGDYLTCRNHVPSGHNWIASGYTLQGGSNRTNIEPRFVHFSYQ
jgi:hypothetical protein